MISNFQAKYLLYMISISNCFFSITPTYVGLILGLDIVCNACITFLSIQLITVEWKGLASQTSELIVNLSFSHSL